MDRTVFYHQANLAYLDLCKSRDRKKFLLENRFSRKVVNEIDFEEWILAEVEEISHKISNWKSKRTPMKCFNCHSSDHLLKECPEDIDRFFCFRCGKEGVTTPKCSTCSLNLKRSAE